MALDTWLKAADGTSAASLGDNEYLEHKDSGKESYRPGGSNANRVFLVRWDRRASFLNDLLGYAFLDGDLAVNRVLPDEHPMIANFYAMDADVDGFGSLTHDDEDYVAWTCARISCQYRPVPYAILEDNAVDSEMERFTSRHYGFNSDYLTVRGAMKYVTRTENKGLTAQPGKIIGSQSVQLTWHDVPGKADSPFAVPNFDNVIACQGKVNSVAFDIAGDDYPAGTVLFLGCDPKMVTPKLTDDFYYWDITMSFLVRDNGEGLDDEQAGHNYIFDVQNDRWDLVTSDGTDTGTRIYEEADLNDLWVIT